MSSSAPISSIVYSRYAKALLDLAEQGKVVDIVQRDMLSLGAMLDDSKDLRTLISSPLFGAGSQSAAMDGIAQKAKLNELTQRFVGVLVKNRRLDALPGIIKAYDKVVLEKSGQVNVCLQTAAKMTEAQLKEFKTKIEIALKATVKLEESVSPEILGGMVVTIGSYMIDDSVRRKLERLGMALKINANQNTVKNYKEVV